VADSGHDAQVIQILGTEGLIHVLVPRFLSDETSLSHKYSECRSTPSECRVYGFKLGRCKRKTGRL